MNDVEISLSVELADVLLCREFDRARRLDAVEALAEGQKLGLDLFRARPVALLHASVVHRRGRAHMVNIGSTGAR